MVDLSGVVGGLANPIGQLAGEATGNLAQTTSYVVQSGDTLGGIAAGQGVSVGALLDANPQILHADLIQAGDQLTIPAAAAPVAPEEEAAAPGAPAMSAPAEGSDPLSGTPADADPSVNSGVPSSDAPSALAQTSLPLSAQGDSGDLMVGAIPITALGALTQPASEGMTGLSAGMVSGPNVLDPDLAQLLAFTDNPGVRPMALAAIAERLAIPLSSLTFDVETSAYLALSGRAPDLAQEPAFTTSTLPTPPASVVLDAPPPGVDRSIPARASDRGPTSRDRKGVEERRSRAAPPTSPQRQWIERALPAARHVKETWGVPIAVTLAHGALASDWGRLAPGNDFFGLLARSPGERSRALTLVSSTVAGRSGFDDLTDAADAFGAALRGDQRCARAFRASDPGVFVGRLAEDGAVVGPRYAQSMVAVIALNGLEAFDG